MNCFCIKVRAKTGISATKWFSCPCVRVAGAWLREHRNILLRWPCDTAVFPFCREVGTQLASFSFSHSGLFPLHCQDIGSKLCCRLTVQINKRRQVSQLGQINKVRRGWKPAGVGESRGESKTEVEGAAGNQLSPQLHVKLTGTFFPPRGNDCSGAQWGLISDYDWVCIQCPACKTWEGDAVKSWFIMPLHPGYLIVIVGDVKSWITENLWNTFRQLFKFGTKLQQK